MNVLMINGSPRPKGNTSIALREMEQIFVQEGIQVETIQIGNRDIRGKFAVKQDIGNHFVANIHVYDTTDVLLYGSIGMSRIPVHA